MILPERQQSQSLTEGFSLLLTHPYKFSRLFSDNNSFPVLMRNDDPHFWHMKSVVDKRLFWFLKEGTELDLSNKAHLDMYVQQALSKGKISDIKKLFKVVAPSDFIESFSRVKSFLPKEVRKFWEEWLGDINQSSRKDTPPF
jgi:hypothetical protein